MNNQELLERFTALLDLVKKSHDNCRQKMTDVMSLIDVFAQHHGLGLAFREDCEKLLPGLWSCSNQLVSVLNDINNALWCGSNHILDNARLLNSPIIDHFMRRIDSPVEDPN